MNCENIKPIFTKRVNLSNPNDMVNFLAKHCRYWTMNSWNRLNSYANNVKLHNLHLPEDICNKAYDFLGTECEEYDEQLRMLLSEFKNETGYFAGFNGRSNGYIVLYDSVRNPKTGELCMSNTSIDGNCNESDFAAMDTYIIRERVKLVTRFDKLCDDIRELFIRTVNECEFKTETYYAQKSRTIAVLPDNNTESNNDNTGSDTGDDNADAIGDKIVQAINAEMASEKDEMSFLTAEQEERIYRKVQRRYYINDAVQQVRDKIWSIVGTDALDTLTETDYQNALKLYSLSISDFKTLAQIFEDDHDCDCDDNSQWSNLIDDYIDNIDFGELIVDLKAAYEDYTKDLNEIDYVSESVKKKTTEAYTAYCAKQKTEKPDEMPLTYNEYIAEYGFADNSPIPSFDVFMQNDYFEFMRSR